MGTSGGIRIALVIVLALSVIPFSRIDAGILPAFADSDPSAKMNPWSPSTAGIPGQTTFTFSADATASAGLARVEWDFDGDGGVDAPTLLAGQNHVNGLTTSYVYSSDGIFWPQVRSVDLAGQYSGWDRYRSSGNDVPLIVSWPAPFITMLQWQPFNVAAGQTVTFSATAFNPVGIQGFEWDLDGDNMPDTFTPADVPGATSASGSVQWVFTGALAAFPQVRALDNDGFLSTWDIYDINGQPVQMVVGGGTPPAVAMNQWAPYSATGPDGQPSTVFSFSADASSSAGLASVEWDFGGDGVPDHVESLAGQTSMTVTASHTYGQVGSWIPTVRVVDINGLDSGWTPYLVGGQPVALDTAAAPSTLAVTLNFAPRAASDVGPDGTTATAFTFTATASNPAVSYAWDFDGDASVDLTTTVPTATHTYPAAGSYLASVTVTDNLGQVKSTTALDSLGGGETVDVSPTAPVATMNPWAPYSATGPDGHERTPFTFSASASASAGVKKIEWD
ncbi:PKD domain-containing protein, partial [Nitrososphaera sp.]|uniref:PKD domain-containing protein n=1 Tax=Nitrososphaera sp. TaxID=1971748 RepID=UPI00307F423B